MAVTRITIKPTTLIACAVVLPFPVGACDAQLMKIERTDFDAMLAQGFAFGPHLHAGRRYYSELFAAPAELAK